jgi:hypothetical protein
MATYKSNAGAILQPGNQINRLSGYNVEGVYGWPGVEAFELIGYARIGNLAADKASFKSFDITVPSPDRRPDDRVRDNRTSLVVNATSARPAYVVGASIAVAQDYTVAGFPADPTTANIGGTSTELLMLGPSNGGAPFGIPSPQLNGLAAATSSITASTTGSFTGFAQGLGATTAAGLPFASSVTGTIVAADLANSMMYKVVADTTFKVFNTTAITSTSVNGSGIFISQADYDAGRAGYLVCRVTYIRPQLPVAWRDIDDKIDFASQVGGDDI